MLMDDYTQYCTCKSCENIDASERNGYKWYCTAYRTYEDPDELVKDKKCKQYRERK